MKIVAKIYAVLLGVLALYAWYTDIRFLHSSTEHLLPDMLLAFASVPTSLSLQFLPTSTPPLLELAWLTLCAAVQAGIVFFLASLVSNYVRTRLRKHDA
jgi:hypothetical protein